MGLAKDLLSGAVGAAAAGLNAARETVQDIKQNYDEGKYDAGIETVKDIASNVPKATYEVGKLTVRKVIRTGEYAIGAGTDIYHGNYGEAVDKVVDCGKNVWLDPAIRSAKFLGKSVKFTAPVAGKVIKREELTDEDIETLRQAGIVWGTAAVAIFLSHEVLSTLLINIDGTDTVFAGLTIDMPVDDIPGVYNGLFTGDATDLDNLIQLGEVPDTEHVESIRSMEQVNAFYQLHGLEPTPGYEVHHIIPLSEGGADHPDNMVLVSSEQHDEITAAHAKYYGWHD